VALVEKQAHWTLESSTALLDAVKLLTGQVAELRKRVKELEAREKEAAKLVNFSHMWIEEQEEKFKEARDIMEAQKRKADAAVRP
jgi:hypothetical protein